MNKLLLRISELPQSIQDIIGMYNVEHRKQMKIICEDLKHVRCDDCGDYISKIKSISVSILFNDYTFCDLSCEWSLEYEIRKGHRGNRQIMHN